MKNGFTLTCFIIALSLSAQTPSLVVDFNPGAADAFNEFNFMGQRVGDALVLPVAQVGFGEELGVLRDGELFLLKDINPGIEGSEPTEITRYNDVLIFAANHAQNGWAIWQTDGTEAGTTLLHDPGTSELSRPRGFTLANSGNLYYTYGDELYKYDGNSHESIFTGVFFSTDFNSASNRHTTYQDEIAFLKHNSENEVELYTVQNGEVQLLAKTQPTDSFASFYGLTEINGGLIFAIEDIFENENEGTYFYSAGTQTIDNFEILGGFHKSRRMVPYSDSKVFAMVLDQGYMLLNGSDNEQEVLFNAPESTITAGQIVNTAIYQGNMIFDVNEGFFGDDYLVYSKGTSASTQNLFEINFPSNFIKEGKYAFMAQGTSNGFDPVLYQIDLSDGSYEILHSFNESSSNTESVLLVGVLDDKLYMVNKLDNAVGRELYAIDVDLVNSLPTFDEPTFDILVSAHSFQIISESQSKVDVNIFDAAGRLVQFQQAIPDMRYDLCHLKGIHFIEFIQDSRRLIRKFLGH